MDSQPISTSDQAAWLMARRKDSLQIAMVFSALLPASLALLLPRNTLQAKAWDACRNWLTTKKPDQDTTTLRMAAAALADSGRSRSHGGGMRFSPANGNTSAKQTWLQPRAGPRCQQAQSTMPEGTMTADHLTTTRQRENYSEQKFSHIQWNQTGEQ